MSLFSRLISVAARFTALAASATALVAADASLDSGFVDTISPGLTPADYPSFANGTGAVNAVGLQTDGKIIAGGNVSRYQTAGSPIALKRLLASGALDTSFNSGGAGLAATGGNPEVNVLLVDSTNRIYVGGTFSSYNGTARSGILRLLADGSLDTAYAPTGLGGTNRFAQTLALQPDGKLLVGGTYTSINGNNRSHLARLNADGTLDSTFTAFAAFSSTFTSSVRSIALLPDGRILVGGLNTASQPVLIRLQANGALDSSFAAPFSATTGAVNKLARLPDGRIAAAGFFTLVATGAEAEFAVFHADGSLDTTFQDNIGTGPNGSVLDLALAPDGTLLVSGVFNLWNGRPRASVTALNLDGTQSPGFAPAPYTANRDNENIQPFYRTHFYSLALQPDGKLVAGGWFDRVTDPAVETVNLTRFVYDHVPAAPGAIRVLATTTSVAENAGSLTLQVARSGGTGGLVTVSYATSSGGALGTATAGADYTPASGTLTWAAGEGGIKSVTLPILQDTTPEAAETFNFTLSNPTGGATLASGATQTVVTVLDDDSAPSITRDPASTGIVQGTSFTLSVRYASVLPATVQWQRDPDGAGPLPFADLPGATSLDYTVAAADPTTHAGSYRAVVTNSVGSATSAIATVELSIPAGSVVTSYVPPALNESVMATAIDASGRHLIATQLGLRRYTATGTTDSTFTTATFATASVTDVHVLSDGKILVGGFFDTVNGGSRPDLARFNADGTFDSAYVPALPAVNGLYVQCISPGMNSTYYVGFGSGGGLRRYLANGTHDTTFNATTVGTNLGGIVYDVRERSDGRVLVAHISGANGFGFTYSLTLLEANGTVAPTSLFTPPTFNNSVRCIELLPDDRIAIGGQFFSVSGVSVARVAILHPDGSVDRSFRSPNGYGPDGTVHRLLYRHGRLVVAGEFFKMGAESIRGLARIHLDGSRDTTFAAGAGANGSILTAQFTASSDLLVGGNFTSFKGLDRQRLALVVGDTQTEAVGFAPPALTVIESGTTVTLTARRYGANPAPISIRWATSGVDASLGDTAAVAGTDFLGASGTLSWGRDDYDDKTITLQLFNDTTVETTKTFRVLLSDPTGPVTAAAPATIHILDDDTPATFTLQPSAPSAALNVGAALNLSGATVASPTPVSYQWFRNGVAVPGATSTSFAKNPVTLADAGLYTLVATNAAGATSSQPLLVVVQPLPGRPFAQPTSGRPQFDSFSGPTSLIALPDGGALIGGMFTANTTLNRPQSFLLRVRADGTTDPAFNLALNAAVVALRAQSDGKILVLGNFNTVNTVAQRYLVRLNADLSLDTTFNTAVAAALTTTAVPSSASAVNLAVDSAGRIYIGYALSGGGFIRRLAATGALDETYLVGTSSGAPMALAVDASDRLLAGGFANIGSVATPGATPTTSPARPQLARLSLNGAVDTSFLPALGSNSVRDLVIQPGTGRIFAGLDVAPGLVEVLADGTGTVFNLGNNNSVAETALSPEGRPTIALSMTGVSAVQRFLPAATPGGSASTETAYTTGGTGPNGRVTTLAYRPDGALWIAGDFTSINGVSTASVALLQPGLTDPAIVNPPARVDATAGATARFSVGAIGSGLTYQWRKNGQPLANDARISGVTTAILTITGVTAADDALYSVIVSGTAAGSAPVTSSTAKLNLLGAPAIIASPALIAPAVGSTVTLAADVLAASPATYAWTRGGVPIINGGRYSGATTGTLVITGANAADNGAYTLTVTNALGAASTTPATVSVAQAAASLVTAYSATGSSNGSNPVEAILHLPDGRTLLGGSGGFVGANSTSFNTGLVVVNATGEISLPAAGVFNGSVQTLLLQPDGKILVGGGFTTVGTTGGSGRVRIARLLPDLSLDPSFTPPQPSNTVFRLALDSTGRIYLQGSFTHLDSQLDYSGLARLSPSGALDLTFKPLVGGSVLALRILPDDSLLVGGSITAYAHGGTTTLINGLVRIAPSGAPAGGFSPALAANTSVQAIDIDASGRLLLAANVAGSISVVRLENSGAASAGFSSAQTFGAFVHVLRALPSGAVLVGGEFTTPTTRLARLAADGTLDSSFATGTGFTVASGTQPAIKAIAPDALGRFWIGGTRFTNYNGIAASRLVVLQGEGSPALAVSTPPAPQTRDLGGSATFTAEAAANNGFTFQWLKNGQPLADGGRISGATTGTLTIDGLVAADAASYSVRVTTPAAVTTSSAAALTVLAAPEILGSPASLTVDLGGSATFTGSARGAGSLSYQWLHGTTALSNGTVAGVTITGATTPSLTVSGLTFAQAGEYRLRVANTLGQATTQAAVLTVERRPGSLASGIGSPSASGVRAIIRLSDGSMLVGGSFTSVTVNGVAQTCGRIARFLADGTLDPAFTVSFNNTVTSLAQDSSGRIFVGGNFTSVTIGATTTNRTRVARLTSAFALDTAFDTSTAGPNAQINAVAPTDDGGVYVGGAFGFNLVGTATVNRVARLSATGALDTGFTAAGTINNEVKALLRRSDGKLYVGGTFGTALLNATGARDTAFTADAPNAFLAVQAQAFRLLSDGSLLVGANGGLPQPYLRRLNANTGATLSDYGTLHANQVSALAQQADGKLLSGANGGFVRSNLAGVADTGLGGFNSTISAIAMDNSGRIWVGGSFNTYNGVAQSGLAVLTGGDFESRDGLLLPQTLTFPAITGRTYGSTVAANTLTLSATSNVGLTPITFAVTSGPATVTGNSLVITGAGTVTVTASQAGNATYASATATQTFTVAKAAQTITFGPLAAKTVASPAFTVSATASSGLPVAFTLSSDPAGIATLAGNTVTLSGTAGTVTVTATQPGDANYAAATAVPQTFAVTAGTAQTITFNALTNRLAGAKFTVAATTTSGLPVAFTLSSDPAGIATLGTDGKTVTVGTTAGTVTIRATQDGGVRNGITYAPATPVDQSFEVTLGPPSRAQKITFPKVASPTYGQAPLTLAATADSGLPVSFTLVSGPATLDGTRLTLTGAGNVVVRATQPGNAVFKAAARVDQTIVVKKASLAVTFDSVTRGVGQNNPTFSPIYSGFVGDDTAADLAANRPRGTTKATKASPAGVYPITVSGGLDARYTFVAGEPATLTVIGYGGDYEALLLDANQRPVGLLTLKVLPNTLAYTGTLALASEAAAVSLRGNLVPAADLATATHTFTRAAPAKPTATSLPALSVTYTVTATTASGVAVTGSVTRDGVKVGDFAQGVRLGAPPAPLGSAAYTLVLPAASASGAPTAPGYATGSIAANTGLLKLTGQLGDGSPLTASLRTAPDRTYRVWVNPYAKRLHSYLGGTLTLRPHPATARFPGLYYVPATEGRLWWAKAAGTTDAAYRAGFGPIELTALLDPWLAPTTSPVKLNNVFVPAGTLAQRLGLSGTPAPLGLDHGTIDGTAATALPETATMAGLGITAIAGDDTLWKLKPVTATSGAFTGSFTLLDTVVVTPATATRPAVTKTVRRNIVFKGVLRQRPSFTADDDLIGAAQFLIAPAGAATTAEKRAVSLELIAP